MTKFTALIALLVLVEAVNCIRFSESLYAAYRQIENGVLSDPKSIFKLREAFYPSTSNRNWNVDRVQVVPISFCLTFNSISKLESCCNTNETNITFCTSLRWTNSYLFNLIPGELLVAMDPVIYKVLYSVVVRSQHSKSTVVKLEGIHVSNCAPSYSDFLSASALFFTWVCMLTYVCM